MDGRTDPSSLLPQEQMFNFSSINDTGETTRTFFPNNATGMSLSQDDFMRQQDGNMEDCCDPHQYMPPTPSSPLSFPPFPQGMTNPRPQITSVSSSDGNCSRPFQHSPYHDNQVSSSFPMNSTSFYNRAQLPTVPTSKPFTGEHTFEISFGPPTESAPKSATWTYSTKTSKLYTNIGSYCPFQFKTNTKPLLRPAYIRAVAMFKGSSNLHDIVKMCANHAENNTDDPMHNNFFVRSNNTNAVYLECPQTGRHSLLVPYSGPQAGTNYVTEMFSFKCFSSCASGHGRKPIEIIFTLEDADSGNILGRCVVEVRVCACPGRDRRSDELNQEKAILPQHGNKRGAQQASTGLCAFCTGSKQKSYNRKKVKKSSSQEEYTITTPFKDVHDMLMSIKVTLESKFYSKSDVDDDADDTSSGARRGQSSSSTASTSSSESKPGFSACM